MTIFAKIISESKTRLLPGKLAVRELFFEVPRDYSKPGSEKIRLFARAVTRHTQPVSPPPKDEPRPWLVYLEGGPGFPPPAPNDTPLTQIILDRGYQLLYLDPRGTGLSTPITATTLALQGSTSEQARYMMSFRADSIVEDCEAIRRTLTKDLPTSSQKWSVLGQSFGGFCILNYLSRHPSGLTEAFTLGGLGGLTATASEVYTESFKKVIERNHAYYTKYPEDISTIHELASYISSQPGGLLLPAGGRLTTQRLMTMGIQLGFHGGIDRIHDQILRMSTDLSQFSLLTRPTLAAFERAFFPFDSAIIYALLHEPEYNQRSASTWAAYSVGLGLKEFQWLRPDWDVDRSAPLFFSGEMVFPFMFDVYPELRQVKDVAEILAKHEDWPELYDLEQLAQNEVPLYSATFTEDIYVPYTLARTTAQQVNRCKQFVTNLLYHDAVRSYPREVLNKLFELRDDTID